MPAKPKPKPMTKRQRVQNYLAGLSKMQKIFATVAAAGGAAAVIYSGLTFARASMISQFGAWPYASQVTEIVVAGWQADRLANDMRDIQSRVERLNTRKRVDPKFNFEDQKELDYWMEQLRQKGNILKRVEMEQRPWVQQAR